MAYEALMFVILTDTEGDAGSTIVEAYVDQDKAEARLANLGGTHVIVQKKLKDAAQL